ncbi:MAG: hypothetical protein LBK53_09385 [Heliobacteriaceae bacterium]|jgi:hypothetical protein|nr:hypothetical protein [Heliobacteriaceae bacterium]
MTATQKLTGKNTHTYTFDITSPIVGDGTTELAAGYYLVKSVASTSGLPTGAEPGKTFRVGGTAEITPEVGDVVYLLSPPDKSGLADRCDFTSFTAEFTFDEIDATTQCDEVKVYEKGLADATITVEGVATAGLSEDLISKVLPIVKQSADFETIENVEVDDNPFYFYTELTYGVTKAGVPDMAFVFPGKLFGFNLGGAADGMQTFSSNVRIVSDDNLVPHVYELLKA